MVGKPRDGPRPWKARRAIASRIFRHHQVIVQRHLDLSNPWSATVSSRIDATIQQDFKKDFKKESTFAESAHSNLNHKLIL
jgi:hypothetical protein